MYELKKNVESYLRVNLLGPGPRLIKKNLPGRGLTKGEEHCDMGTSRMRPWPSLGRWATGKVQYVRVFCLRDVLFYTTKYDTKRNFIIGIYFVCYWRKNIFEFYIVILNQNNTKSRYQELGTNYCLEMDQMLLSDQIAQYFT